MDRFKETVASANVKAIEVKLSQGAKPGKGGVLPGVKVTKEISIARGIPIGKSCLSPANHSAFGDADELLDFVESLAAATGLPIGIKSAVGQMEFFEELARLMGRGDRGVDYIQVDGGEGGTGAAPLAFSDHVAMPFKLGFARVWRLFREAGIEEDIVWVGSGKLGFPAVASLAFGLGCDMIGLAREPMLAVGCIQAQLCHTGHCPTGVATQTPWLVRGLDPTHKSDRLANYIIALRKEVLDLCHAMGSEHPALLTPTQFEILDETFGSRTATDVFGYEPTWGHPTEDQREQLAALMASTTEAA